MMRKYAVLGFEPMTYGSQGECATQYTTAPQTDKDKVDSTIRSDSNCALENARSVSH